MNDALEQRAQLHLLGQLGHERSRGWRRDRAGLDPAARDDAWATEMNGFEAAVDAFRALGAISAAEDRTWRRRFEAAATEGARKPPVPDADTRERVEGFLAELFASHAAGDGQSPEEQVRSFRRSVFAIEEVGAISLEDAHRWIDRISVERGLPTPREEKERERMRTCTALDLRRVIAAPMAVGALQVSHLELYADGALLYSLETGPGRGSVACGADPRSARPFSKAKDSSPLTVSDDLGTVYETTPYHGFAKSLTPPVPSAAGRLEISYAGEVGEIALR